jgi:hypothetical protein
MNGNTLDLINENAQQNHKQHTFEHIYFWAMPLEKPQRENQFTEREILLCSRRKFLESTTIQINN